MAVFAIRLSRERREISQVEIMGKFAGAVGNYNAHLVAYPDVKWPQIAEDFVQSLGLSFNPYVTQVSFLHLFFLQSKNFFWASSIHFTFLSNLINS
jgi:adenylosuccinate lyase